MFGSLKTVDLMGIESGGKTQTWNETRIIFEAQFRIIAAA